MNSARIYVGIRSSNGVLESQLRAVILRKLGEQNRARNMQKQSHRLRMKHIDIGTCRTGRR